MRQASKRQYYDPNDNHKIQERCVALPNLLQGVKADN